MESLTDTEERIVTAAPARWLGHPRGLWVIGGTELWDRISWHGMVSMLVLYMTGELLKPERIAHVGGWNAYRATLEWVLGPLGNTAIATQTFSLYFAAITFLPLIGGWLGDRAISRRTGVTVGALVMTLGHFLMAFDSTFLAALLSLSIGAGFLRGNLSPQIRALYAAGDRRLGEAFQVYAICVNMGAFIAPLACSTVAKYYGWHAGFAVAGLGMLIGLVWYLFGSRHLPPQPIRESKALRTPFTTQDRRNLMVLALLWPFSVAFWTSQAQIWNVYNVWVRDHVAMDVAGFAVPVPWLQSLDGLAPAAFIPLVILLFRTIARRGDEPDTLFKMAAGCLIFAAATLILAAGPLMAGTDGRTPIWGPVVFHLTSNLGAALFVPLMQATFAARAPERLRGTLLGVYALSITAASLISGPMGGWYDHVSPPTFWIATAAIVGVAGVLLLLIARPLRRWMGPDAEPEEGGAAH